MKMKRDNNKPQPLKITAQKAAQIEKQGGMVKGRPLRHSVAIESRYVSELVRLVNQMTAQTERALLPGLREVVTEFAEDADTPDPAKEAKAAKKAATKSAAKSAAETVAELQAKFESLFSKRAKGIADTMLGAVTKESATNLSGSLAELSGQMTVGMGFMGGEVGDTIRDATAENIALIKSIPANYMARVHKHLMKSAESGGDMTGLISKIQDAAGIEKRRAKNIALDQTRKAYNTINAKRMEAVGVKKYEWVHSGGGQRPRHKHITRWPAGLTGGIFELAKPPNAAEDGDPPYYANPGVMINCKCTMAPVIDFGDDDGPGPSLEIEPEEPPGPKP